MSHVKEANRLLIACTVHGAQLGGLIDAAQVHAILALVEQQRIANLIALGTHGAHRTLSEQVSADVAGVLATFKKHSIGGFYELKPEIQEALGIGGTE